MVLMPRLAGHKDQSGPYAPRAWGIRTALVLMPHAHGPYAPRAWSLCPAACFLSGIGPYAPLACGPFVPYPI